MKNVKIMDNKDQKVPHFVTSHDFRGDVLRPEKLHQLGAELQSAENIKHDDNPSISLLICKSKDRTKVEWAFDSIQNPMGVATYQGIKIADKLPSVEALQERIKLLEAQLEKNARVLINIC